MEGGLIQIDKNEDFKKFFIGKGCEGKKARNKIFKILFCTMNDVMQKKIYINIYHSSF